MLTQQLYVIIVICALRNVTLLSVYTLYLPTLLIYQINMDLLFYREQSLLLYNN